MAPGPRIQLGFSLDSTWIQPNFDLGFSLDSVWIRPQIQTGFSLDSTSIRSGFGLNQTLIRPASRWQDAWHALPLNSALPPYATVWAAPGELYEILDFGIIFPRFGVAGKWF